MTLKEFAHAHRNQAISNSTLWPHDETSALGHEGEKEKSTVIAKVGKC